MLKASYVGVALALLLAGCIGQGEPLESSALRLPVLGDPLVLDHDHADPALHDLQTSNVVRLAHLAWDPQVLDRYPLQQWGEIDVEGDFAFVAALWSGFSIVDISSPQPRTLSSSPVLPAYVADIKAAEGGDLVLLGLQGSVSGTLRAFTGQSLPVAAPALPVRPGVVGVQAWDARDKAAPRLAGHMYVEGGCHMLSVLEQAQGTIVYCAPNDNTVRIFRVQHAGEGVVFEPLAVWGPGDVSELVDRKVNPVRAQFTHDMTAQLDPLTGEPVMYVSFWDLGVYVVDVRDPSAPGLLGVWAGEDAQLWGGKVHTSLATLLDGRRVVITIPEYADIPAMFILDATDYSKMRLLSEWQAHPDGDYGEKPAIFSTHNFQVVGTRLYMAMYHGGVWAFDVADPEAPRAIGYYLPHEEPGVGAGTVGAGLVPDVWDVVVANGYAYAVDIPSGLHVLGFAGDPLGDADYDSFA